MIRFTVRTQIERPTHDVYTYVTDPSKLANWQTNTVLAEPLKDGPLTLGTQIREIHRGPGGKELASVVEVSELKPDELFALKMIDGPLPLDAHIELQPDDAGTKMSFTVTGQPHGIARIAQPLLAITLKRQFASHCENLKQVLEGSRGADGRR